jgi:hypothetical protein
MITFEQIKNDIIETEKDWIREVHGDNEEAVEYIQGVIKDMNNCKTISDLVYWYNDKGYDISEAYEVIIANLMAFGSINN